MAPSGYNGIVQVTKDDADTFHYTTFQRSLGRGVQGTVAKLPNPNDQIDEPAYEWANCQGGTGDSCSGGTNIDFFTEYVRQIRSGQHYHNDTRMPGYVAYCYPHPLQSGLTTCPSSAR